MTQSSSTNPVLRLQKLWQRLEPLPGGAWLFSRILGWVIPYTGTIGATVKELRPGFARIQMRERRRVRNHLNSVHALALANLGELASGLAMLGNLAEGLRGIPTLLSIEYFKKARGTLTAEGHCLPLTVTEDIDFEVYADIHDASGDKIARITVKWRIGPVPVASRA